MKCETIRNMLSSYIDKDLNDIEKTELEKHLTECAECKKEYDNMLDIIAVCGNLEEIELPQNFRTELHTRLIEEKGKRNFFSGILEKRYMKMATGIAAAVLVIAIGIGSSALFFNNSGKTAQTRDSASSYGEAAAPAAPYMGDVNFSMDIAPEKQYETAVEEELQMNSVRGVSPDTKALKFKESLTADAGASSPAIESSRSGRMVIRSGNISVNVENVDKATVDIRQLTESSGGYVENSQIDNITVPQPYNPNGSPGAKEVTEKYANMTLRVPEAKFEVAFNSIKGMGKLISENMSGSDITSEYVDTEARVDNLKIQEQSLKQLMTKANNVDEILKIESELNRVRTDIDIKSGNLKNWDNLVKLSTIYIYMKELKPEELKNVDMPGMWEKAYRGFIKAINSIVTGLENIVITLITATPYLIIAVILAAIGIVVIKRVKLKKL